MQLLYQKKTNCFALLLLKPPSARNPTKTYSEKTLPPSYVGTTAPRTPTSLKGERRGPVNWKDCFYLGATPHYWSHFCPSVKSVREGPFETQMSLGRFVAFITLFISVLLFFSTWDARQRAWNLQGVTHPSTDQIVSCLVLARWLSHVLCIRTLKDDLYKLKRRITALPPYPHRVSQRASWTDLWSCMHECS